MQPDSALGKGAKGKGKGKGGKGPGATSGGKGGPSKGAGKGGKAQEQAKATASACKVDGAHGLGTPPMLSASLEFLK